jgi:diacylglycerol kinase family enzyme
VTSPGERVPVYLNAGAGRTTIDPAALQQQLGPELVEVHVVPGDRFAETIQRAASTQPAVLGVAGGDGSMHAAAAAIAGTSTALAAVPAGTLNNFARRIGIRSIEEAAMALRIQRVQSLPLGTVHDRIFLNTLTFGEYSRIVRLRERYRSAVGKWPAAALAFAIASFSIRRFNVTVTTDDHSFTRRTPFVWLGVGWGSFPRVHEALERRATPDLEMAILRSDSRAAGVAFVLRLGARMLARRRPIRDRALEVLHTRAVVIDSDRPLDVTADGEVLRLQPPVNVGVRDGALRVLLGPGIPPGGQAT